jgi:hypothetical protein
MKYLVAILFLAATAPAATLTATRTHWTYGAYDAPGTLSEHILTNIIARTNGRVAALWTGYTNCAQNGAGMGWVTNGFLTGLTGYTAISPANTLSGCGSQVQVTALTRRHGYARGHGMGDGGEYTNENRRVWFIGTNGTPVEMGVSAKFVSDRSTNSFIDEDWTVLFFTNDLPAEVEVMRYVTYAELIPKLNPSRLAIFGTCQHNLCGSDNFAMFPDGHSFYIGGDSGSPNVILSGNELLFLNGKSTTGVSSNMLWAANLLTEHAGLSTNDYQFQHFDLSPWPDL